MTICREEVRYKKSFAGTESQYPKDPPPTFLSNAEIKKLSTAISENVTAFFSAYPRSKEDYHSDLINMRELSAKYIGGLPCEGFEELSGKAISPRAFAAIQCIVAKTLAADKSFNTFSVFILKMIEEAEPHTPFTMGEAVKIFANHYTHSE
jgi:hypothetical protein